MLAKRIDPAAGAIIMANGIFLYGGVQAFPIIDQNLGKLLSILLFLAWLVIYWRLSVQFFQKDFLRPFLNNPIQSFTIGTWIAGVSVLCNVLLKYYPAALPFLQGMAVTNVLLWAVFLVTMIKSFKKLLTKQTKTLHGVILLSTVGTQSIVILLKNLFNWIPIMFVEVLVFLGIGFYVLGIYLLTRRYVLTHWTLIEDWKNTNCIIHGALSITGLAMVTAQLMTTSFMVGFWLFVLTLVILVEGIELARAYQRVKKLGFSQGIWTYHISQWSRNFTFGMFFAFTVALNESSAYQLPKGLIQFQDILLPLWAKIVLLSLVLQIWLYAQTQIKYSKLSLK
ncbi:hypothetical protein [Piscibacillus halophilus]|uniref:hypothetical protein n=1 Tax=Piscibacillus halophilus TaxID=571933 RepID=UPI00158D5D53|nr:hypothetical protein [Piscibacillus halophilus]